MAIIIGTEGNNLLVGTADDDEIHGLGGNDTLRGLEGADILYGGVGFDSLNGGLGDDLLDGGDSTGDRVTYVVGATAGVTVDLRIQGVAQDTGSQGLDTLVGIEFLVGTGFDDLLNGDAADNFLWSGVTTPGVTGNDTIFGHEGNDLIVAGTGNHRVDGGSGTDTWSVYGNGTDVTGGVTLSLLQQGVAQDTGQGLVVATGFENLGGSIFNDTLIGDDRANILAGASGDDRLVGGEGNDVLLGDGLFGLLGDFFLFSHMGFVTHGNDVLEGGEGHDTLVGGEGDDILSGGGGHDRFSFGTDIFGFIFDAGHDRITDFEKKDVLVFKLYGVDDISDLTIVEDGGDVVITWGTAADSITIENFKAEHLSAGNFVFEDPAALETFDVAEAAQFTDSKSAHLGAMDFWLS